MGGIGYFSQANYYPFINNMLMDLNVLEACEKFEVERLFYPSSACAYPPSAKPLTEEMLNLPAQPDQMYGWEKLSILKLAANAPFDVRVGVLHTIFGAGQTWQGQKAKFPPQMVAKCLTARDTGKVEIWGDGTQTRTFLYIDDAIGKIYDIMSSDKYHGPVNISSDEEVTINECVNYICEYLHIQPQLIYLLDKPVGPTSRGADNSKYNLYYKYRSRISTRQGFEKLTDWMRQEMEKKH